MKDRTENLLGILEQLASEIREVSILAAQVSDPYDRLLVTQLARYLEWVLGELSQRPGVLSGEMPWWREWRALPGQDDHSPNG